MRALVLDFDGVISDSAREAYAIATRTYRDVEPGSRVLAGDAAHFRRFVDLMPLGNRAEDFGVALAAIEADTILDDQPAYDRYRAARPPGWLDRFHRRFYEVRAEISGADPAAWRRLVTPYAAFIGILRRRASDVEYAIATARDRPSVLALLATYGVADLFPGERVLDKETGKDKTVHLRRLGDLLGLEFGDMTFVDDKVNHLDAVAALGVRCALAAWGYNGARERQQAAERGHIVCTLEDAERRLFG